MTRRVSSVQIYVYLALVVAVVAADQETCDPTKCNGPLKYYELLGCQPVYEKEGDCCAIRYNCDHLKGRSRSKCYINNNEYEIGEKLKEEDANPCDIGCTCVEGFGGIASFVCAIVDCFGQPPKPGCYIQKSPLHCCDMEEICPENPEDRPTCIVDGKTYRDGEYFVVKDEPDMQCVCQQGYEGNNVEPFCAKPKHPYCIPEFRHAFEIHKKCAPVYYNNQSPQTSCNIKSRCQNDNDTIIHNPDDLKSGEITNEENVCEFGTLKMHIGDELNQATDYDSVCVKCKCEVPPIPTCQHLPDSECDITIHPTFHPPLGTNL